MIHEFARSDWMGLSGGDQSEKINSSHFIVDNLSTKIFFPPAKIIFPPAKTIFPPAKIIFPPAKNFSHINQKPNKRGGGSKEKN